MSKSLGDFIVDRTESLNEESIKEYFVENNNQIITRLLDSENYILEGSRGCGKTMLMKHAEIKAKEDFGKDSVLAVWISFEESLRLERIKIINSSNDPFLQWTMGKILFEILNKILDLKPNCSEILSHRLSSIFDNDTSSNVNTYNKYSEMLNNYITMLEKGSIDNNLDLANIPQYNNLYSILDNPSNFKDFLLSLINDLSLARITLLFDEAAHVFSHSQQEKFFTFFKSLRDPKISCVAAVYPGITNYGKYFERGQDAKEIRLIWEPYNIHNISYIKKLLKKRIQKFNSIYWNKLTINSMIDTICICSNGNPRFAFHIIDDLDTNKCFNKKSITNQMVINSIRSVFEDKWKELSTLQKKLPKYKNYIKEAETFMKDIIIPNIKAWNEKRRLKKSKISLGFYIETRAYERTSKIFDILAYYNIIYINTSKKSIGHGNFGFFVRLNPSLLIADNIIKSSDEVFNASIAIENNQAYYLSTDSIKNLVDKYSVEKEHYLCSNANCGYSTSNAFKFCPQCGNKMNVKEEKSLYKILRSHSINNLKLGRGTINRISTKFENIGEIYDADPEDIRMLYIQDIRIEKIKNAAIEYMAG